MSNKKAKAYKRVRIGQYVYSKICTSAFFQVVALSSGNTCTIQQIDGLGNVYPYKRECTHMYFGVPVTELYNNYI